MSVPGLSITNHTTSQDGLRAGINVQGMDDTGDVTQDREDDVEEEVGAAATLEEDTQRRQDDGEDDLADVAIAKVSYLSHRCGHAWAGFGLSLLTLR
jgi:hypothetical protein